MALSLASILFFLSILGISESRVKFTHSSLYDEYDFIGKTRIEIEECSSVKQCAIFVSISSDVSHDVYENIRMAPEVRVWNFTLNQFAAMRNGTTKEIEPYFITDGADNPSATTYFYNDNEKQIAAPLVIYAVNLDKEPNYDQTSGIFDAADIEGGVVRGKIATILSAKPFTSTISGDKNTMATVFATGFDNADANEKNPDNCIKLMQTRFDNTVSFQINGPIASIYFSDFQGKLIDSKNSIKASPNFDYVNLKLKCLGFVTSPGFVGCKSGQIYRSSLYGSSIQYSLFSADSHSVDQSVYVNTDKGRPVNVHYDTGLRNFNGNDLLTAQKVSDQTHKLEVNFHQSTINSFSLVYSYSDSNCDDDVVDPTESSHIDHTTSLANGPGILCLLVCVIHLIFILW